MGTDIHNVPEMGCGARELQLYVDNGMSPLEAISSATRDAATALGLGADLGTIEARKIADIIAVRGNPADDIGVLQDANAIALVIKEGRLYVDRMAATPRLVRQWKITDRE
jgi:imidazolonepropionase-like amidohydrolase